MSVAFPSVTSTPWVELVRSGFAPGIGQHPPRATTPAPDAKPRNSLFIDPAPFTSTANCHPR